MEPKDALDYAKRVAWSVTRSHDPEYESLAGIASWRALLTWDGRGTIRGWIAHRVKTAIWCHWRKKRDRHEELKDVAWCSEVYEVPPVESAEKCIEPEDWQMLWEKHIEKWCIDVVARRHNMTVNACRKRLNAATQRLLRIHG